MRAEIQHFTLAIAVSLRLAVALNIGITALRFPLHRSPASFKQFCVLIVSGKHDAIGRYFPANKTPLPDFVRNVQNKEMELSMVYLVLPFACFVPSFSRLIKYRLAAT